LSTAISAVAITPDGRYVAFVTGEALVAADTNGVADVYVRDRLSNTTKRASLTSAGSQITLASNATAISADGRFVAFAAAGTGVVPADTLSGNDVFVRDLVADTTVMVSVSAAGAAGMAPSNAPSISDDGRFVAFHSSSTNLAPGMGAPNGQNDSGIQTHVFLHDRDADGNTTFDEAGGIATLLVSKALAGDGGNGSSANGKVSPDGSLVVFTSSAFDLVADDTNSVTDVFLWERQTGIISRINIGAGGVQADRASQPFVQPFGGGNRYIAFVSSATNLVPFDGNGVHDAFVLDRVTGIVSLVSTAANGTRTDQGGINLPPSAAAGSISDDGTRVSFFSSATDLVAGDPSGNNDAFVKTLVGNVLTVIGAPETATFGSTFTVSSIGGGAGTVTSRRAGV
jgi:Tol biopolymer transport system component